MKKILILFLLLSNTLFAQKAPYKVVFDVTSSDTVLHKMVVRWVNEIISADASADNAAASKSRSKRSPN